MEAHGERRYSSYSFKTSAQDAGEWSAQRPGRDLLPAKDPRTHCTGGWVGPRAVLESKEKSFASDRDQTWIAPSSCP
jgi:hypothetical protein